MSSLASRLLAAALGAAPLVQGAPPAADDELLFADGPLIVVVKHEIVEGKPAHTGGGLISKHRFGYGYYPCRSQPFMAGRGVHTAFGQRGMGGGENNSIFEIDSHEIDSTRKITCQP